MNSEDRAPIGIIGAGSIGVAFAIVFARAGHQVRLWDAFPDAFPRARQELAARLEMLALPTATADRILFTDDLSVAVKGVGLIQECAPERLDLKQDLLVRLARLAPEDALWASSSSALLPSAIAAVAADSVAARVLVAHPGNPPYLIPVIELVAGKRTDPVSVDRAAEIYAGAGLRPIRVRREVDGFVFNRLQGAVLREAYCLVRDGVATVDDIDEVMRSGLGRRWSILGPFETVDLNTRGGIASHAQKMGPAYAAMGAERGQHDPWTEDLVAEVTRQRRATLPEEQWADRVRWRDEQLARLTRIWDEDKEIADA